MVFQGNYQSTSALPADCAGEPVGCEVVPIELDVPQEDPDEIEAQGYILTVIVDWDPGQRVDNVFQVGTVYANDLESFLYQNPLAVDSAGRATYTARSNTTQPASLVAVSPTSKKFQLVVANFSGVNNGYTLNISLTSAARLAFDPNEFKTGSKTPDYVQPTFEAPPPSTPQQNGFGGASGPGLFTPGTPNTPSAAPAGFTVPNIAGGKADPMLVAIGDVNVRSGLGLRAVDVESKVASVTAGQSSGRSVAFGLLVLPILIGLGLLFVLLRRRKSSGGNAVPAAA
ncbi:MAG: hypothetical protein ABIO67_01160 [Mycobacteriales bacterium]